MEAGRPACRLLRWFCPEGTLDQGGSNAGGKYLILDVLGKTDSSYLSNRETAGGFHQAGRLSQEAGSLLVLVHI